MRTIDIAHKMSKIEEHLKPEFIAEEMASILMDDSISTYEVMENMVDQYIRSSEEYKLGIDYTISQLTGFDGISGLVNHFYKMVPKFAAYEIDWDIDKEEIIEKISELSDEEAAQILGIAIERFIKMSKEDIKDSFMSKFHRQPGALDDLFGLPQEIKIPTSFNIESEDDDMSEVTEWISDEYGYCINGYQVKKI